MILAPPDELAKSTCVMVRSETSSKSGKAWQRGTIDRSSKSDDGATRPDRNGPLLGWFTARHGQAIRRRIIFWELDNFVYPFSSFRHSQPSLFGGLTRSKQLRTHPAATWRCDIAPTEARPGYCLSLNFPILVEWSLMGVGWIRGPGPLHH
jgi:hypothetical protein